MATTRQNLKGYFNTDDRPTEGQFFELIDSVVHLDEDKASSTLAQEGTDDSKFITPLTAKVAVQTFAPVKTINSTSPDSSGNVAITNVSGSASTITGSITKSQVTGLVTDLSAKQATLVSGTNIKTVNGTSVLGSGNIVTPFVRNIAVPSGSFGLVSTNSAQNAFPTSCDEITILEDKTYFFKGKFLLATGNTAHTTAIGWVANGGLSVNSMEYVVKTFSSAANTAVSTVSNIHISGIGSKVLNAADSAVNTIIEFEGVLRCKSGNGGSITPQITFNPAPTGTNTMKVGSFIEFTEIGDFAVQAIGSVR